MKRVIMEYAGAGLSVIGAIGFLVLLNHFFMGKDGILAVLISLVLGDLK